MRWFTSIILLLLPVLGLAQTDWVRRVLPDGVIDSPVAVCAADFDGDGDIDLAAASRTETKLVWLEQQAGPWLPHDLPSSYGPHNSLDAGDIDGDGVPDLVSCTDSTLAVWINDGAGNFTETLIELRPQSTLTDVEIADMDGDEDADLLVCDFAEDLVFWHEQTAPGTWSLHWVAQIIWPTDADPVDLDGDGDLDVIMTGAFYEPAAVALRTGPGWDFTLLSSQPFSFDAIAAGDMDGDGMTDIAASAQVGHFAWYRQTGDGWQGGYIEPLPLGALLADDLDGDGRAELVAPMKDDPYRVFLYQLTPGGEWEQTELYQAGSSHSAAHAVDLDGDGDRDLLFAAADELYWLEQVEQQPAYVTLTPHPGTLTPAPGGEFAYDLNIQLNLPGFYLGRIWAGAVLPNGNAYGPVFDVQMLLTPDMEVDVENIVQLVPAFAAEGVYEWRVYVGGLNYTVGDWDGFTVTVTDEGGRRDGRIASGWISRGHERISTLAGGQTAGPAQAVLPDEFTISPATPNPFNPETVVTVSLGETGRLRVDVVDILGRTVATLADDVFPAGDHQLSVDGRRWASGAYLVRARVGERTRLSKIVLQK